MLLSPLQRAEYILAQHGFALEEGASLSDQQLIMDVLMAREEVEDAADEEELETLRATNRGTSTFHD